MRALSLLPLLLLASAPAAAELCAPDSPAAATLLLPYFEVDLDGPNGLTTLFSINNASAAPVLARVVLWTDMAVPTLGFDVYLTGFDVHTVNLRDVMNGQLPPWGGGNPPGERSDPNGDFPGCPPASPPPAALAPELAALHTGRPWPAQGGQCAGADHGDGVARGFVTVDVAARCAALLPGDAGYFGPDGVAGFANVLWGDVFLVDPAGNFAQGNNLVRVEARPGALAAGDRTFYRDLVDGTAADAREALPIVWATRFLDGGAFDGGADLLVWRGGPRRQPFACGAPPTLHQGERSILAFDEEENVHALPKWSGQAPLIYFPLAANRVEVGADLPTAFEFGWLLLDLAESDGVFPIEDQAWVATVMSAEGRFSVGLDGTPGTAGCLAGGCLRGEAFGVGRLCVRGAPGAFDQTLDAGEPLYLQVDHSGCFSTTCSFVHDATCGAQRDGSTFDVGARFCVEALPFDECTPDCGAASALCGIGPLPAGTYTARAGDLVLEFSIPRTGALCASLPH